MSSKVSIVIPCYFPNMEMQKYLDLCLESCDKLNYDQSLIDVTVSSSGEFKPVVPEKYRHVHSETRLHFPKAVNQGVRASSPDSKYLFILNDDTCLTKNVLQILIAHLGDQRMILNPISNCDNTRIYALAMGYPKDGQFMHIPQRFFRIEDVNGDEKLLMDAESIYPSGIIATDWLPIYATLIPRSVWNEVGEIDENFMTGQDDLDFSLRCKTLGIARGVVLSALAWHFGGVVSSKVINTEMRQKNIDYFVSKWGHLPA